MCYDFVNRDYCKINNKYFDIANKKELSEKDSYYVPFDNKAGFTLINKILIVYYDNEIIKEFKDEFIVDYLKGYYFVSPNDDMSNTIYELKITVKLDN